MSITVNSRMVADVRIESVMLRPLLGAYELLFTIAGTTKQPIISAGQTSYWFALFGALVSVTSASGQKQSLGAAHSDRPIRMRQEAEHQLTVRVELKMTLSPHQVMAIEDFCHEQEMRFELTTLGEGGVPNQADHRWPLFDVWSISVPRSKWIDQLRSAGALDIFLIEVPMPITDVPPEWRQTVEHLKRAQKMYLEGNYPECVSRCREVMDAIDKSVSATQQWTEALKKLAVREQREQMVKEEREIAILAAVRNYTHLAHHSDTTVGSGFITRSEARLILTMSAASVAHRLNAAALSIS